MTDTKDLVIRMKKRSHVLLGEVDKITITSDTEAIHASELSSRIAGALKKIEEKRISYTKPLNQSLREINADFKIIKQPLEKAKGEVNMLILEWRAKEQEKVEKEEARRRKIQEAHEKKGHEVKAPVVMEKPKKTIGHVTSRKVTKWKVVDFSKVPDRYKMIDSVQLNGAARDEKPEVPGVEFYEEEIAVVR